MTTRLAQKTSKVIPTPSSPFEWEKLLRAAASRAQDLKDPRATKLKTAQGKGQAEKELRRLGIIRLQDIDREFPRKS